MLMCSGRFKTVRQKKVVNGKHSVSTKTNKHPTPLGNWKFQSCIQCYSEKKLKQVIYETTNTFSMQ